MSPRLSISNQMKLAWQILALIAQDGPISETEIAKRLRIHRPRAWRMVKTMRQAGMPLEAVPDQAWNGQRKLWRISGIIPWEVASHRRCQNP